MRIPHSRQLSAAVSTRKARRAGYASLRAYLPATPKTDAEKRAAADHALKGVVICFLGLLFPPLILVTTPRLEGAGFGP